MQQSLTPKQDWVQRIEQVLALNIPFQFKAILGNKLYILFAADSFRRHGHEVIIDIVPTEKQISCLVITIFPTKQFIEFTLRRHDEPQAIIEQIIDSKCTQVSLRGCGTVIFKLFEIMDWALHSGWYLDKTMMSTLTQRKETIKQRNTTLHIIVRKG